MIFTNFSLNIKGLSLRILYSNPEVDKPKHLAQSAWDLNILIIFVDEENYWDSKETSIKWTITALLLQSLLLEDSSIVTLVSGSFSPLA